MKPERIQVWLRTMTRWVSELVTGKPVEEKPPEPDSGNADETEE